MNISDKKNPFYVVTFLLHMQSYHVAIVPLPFFKLDTNGELKARMVLSIIAQNQ